MMTRPILVQLTPSNMHQAALVAVERALDAVATGREGAHGCESGAGFAENINGCMGEMALAKYLDVFWDGAFGDFGAADVGVRHQVRSTPYRGGVLPLNRTDRDDQPFVLAIVRLPRVWLVGWILARDGKLDEHWGELGKGRECFRVPQSVLHDMSTLPPAQRRAAA